jgi:hypothetical protein
MPESSWESLRLDFAQLRRECAIDPPIVNAGRLIAIWTAQTASLPAHWRLEYWNATDESGITERFRSRAKFGAARRGFVGSGDDAVAYWLDELKDYAPEPYARRFMLSNGPNLPDSLYSVEIRDICGLSTDYCWECEADELRSSAGPFEAGLRSVDPFQGNFTARPLGDNPFPEDQPVHDAFEEAMWNAKEKIASFQMELLQTRFSSKAEFIQALLIFRGRWFSVTAHEATLLVGDELTGEWYDSWLDDRAKWFLEDTLARLREKDPKADPSAPPFLTQNDLDRIEHDLQFEQLRIVTNYKGVSARRVQEAIELRKAAAASATAELTPAETGGTIGADTGKVKSVFGRNIDRLRKECGWSFDDLAKVTDLDKKLILGHVNDGKGAHPKTLAIYASVFTEKMGRRVTVAELETGQAATTEIPPDYP